MNSTPHAIGVDYGHSALVIYLRENQSNQPRLRTVGDGQREIVPNVVSEVAWGSQAFEATNADITTYNGLDELATGPWLDTPGADLLWAALYRRLSAFLSVAPISENGYQIIVATYATNQVKSRIDALARDAGFNEPTIIPAVDAVLCAWMAERSMIDAPRDGAIIGVVAVGDTSVQVRAYRLSTSVTDPLTVTATGAISHIDSTGHAYWTRKLLQFVEGRIPGVLPTTSLPALRDAALEVARQLRTTAGVQQVFWSGPLRSQMYAPLSFSTQECRNWPEVSELNYRLAPALNDALRSLTGEIKQPDLLLVGGIGGAWPFVDAALPVLPPERIRVSAVPAEDVARGAVWWPLLNKRSRQVLSARPASVELPPSDLAAIDNYKATPLDGPTPIELAPSSSGDEEPAEKRPDVDVPPWMRR